MSLTAKIQDLLDKSLAGEGLTWTEYFYRRHGEEKYSGKHAYGGKYRRFWAGRSRRPIGCGSNRIMDV